MTKEQMTPEQQRVITHPRGSHARVLAVAGSGKTTTMVERVRHLVIEEKLPPQSICILMFNVRAGQQFRHKLTKSLPKAQRPEVYTFHAFAYRQLRRAMDYGMIPANSDIWTEDRDELVRRTVHTAINALVKRGELDPDSVDSEQALESIGLWKGSLIPPERAGHRTNGRLPIVYREFERLRTQKNAITYDDFVPLAVRLLEEEADMARGVVNAYDAVIVDEYQDVNYGQQRLVELIAGQRADVMVVGDDDQTIYEWRGARPDYIIREFPNVFAGKPTIDYKLSRTFRFGPVLAQSAENVISFNQRRVSKPLIAYRGEAPARIHIFRTNSEQPTDVNKELATQLKALVRETKDPQGVAVLARMFVQLAGLEAECLVQGIPYYMLGRMPFFERTEVVSLLKYLRLAVDMDAPLTAERAEEFESILNVPNRRLSRDAVKPALEQAALDGHSLRRVLDSLTDPRSSPFSQNSREKMDDLADILLRLSERVGETPPPPAHELMRWLMRRANYRKHYDNYYGSGEASEERKITLDLFQQYADRFGKPVPDFLAHVASLDTTLGLPKKDCIMMTTVFRVKGEEFDYVFIPDCKEGYMPCLYNAEQSIFDTRGEISEPDVSDALESERRLFYVAITRAKKAVFVGTSQPPQKGAQSNSNEIAASRFLEEIQLEPVQQVMGLLQEILAGDVDKIPALEAALLRHAGNKPLVHNLLEEYGAEGRFRLKPEIRAALEARPAAPFRYTTRYDSAPPPIEAKAKQPAKRAWWDDD